MDNLLVIRYKEKDKCSTIMVILLLVNLNKERSMERVQ